jgi:DNA-binding NarL/FixJ family response regulator
MTRDLLSRRQREIALLMATGASNNEIAHDSTISTKTVKNILTTVFAKSGTRGRTHRAVQIVRAGSDVQ